ncbi:unnamed protein product, partial [Meganyctiphanes norvegica]
MELSLHIHKTNFPFQIRLHLEPPQADPSDPSLLAKYDEKQDKPPSYDEVIDSEQPPPSYFTAVADTRQMSDSSSDTASYQLKEEGTMSSNDTTIDVEPANASKTEGQENEGDTSGIAEVLYTQEMVVTDIAEESTSRTFY